MEEFRKRRLFIDSRARKNRTLHRVHPGEPDHLLCGDGLCGIAGIHEPANPDHACLREQNVEGGSAHASSLLPDVAAGLLCDAHHARRGKAGPATVDPDFPSLAAVRYARRAAPYGCNRSFAQCTRAIMGMASDYVLLP